MLGGFPDTITSASLTGPIGTQEPCRDSAVQVDVKIVNGRDGWRWRSEMGSTDTFRPASTSGNHIVFGTEMDPPLRMQECEWQMQASVDSQILVSKAGTMYRKKAEKANQGDTHVLAVYVGHDTSLATALEGGIC